MGIETNRTIVVPDIHGCARSFQQLLFKQVKLLRSDTLILLGDLIDRGNDSKGVLDTIMELQRDGYDVRPIRGNHEQMLLQALLGEDEEAIWLWLDNGGRETLKSFGVEHQADIPEEYITFIESLPFYVVTDTHVFVHAGLDFSLDNPLSDEGRNSMLWKRDTDVKPSKIGGRKLVAGHTVRDLDEIIESLDSNFIKLDNGCFMQDMFEGRGNLVALDLNSMKLYVQENID